MAMLPTFYERANFSTPKVIKSGSPFAISLSSKECGNDEGNDKNHNHKKVVIHHFCIILHNYSQLLHHTS